jgi:H+/Cl- antiporter ClcA
MILIIFLHRCNEKIFMKKKERDANRIPISISLQPTLKAEEIESPPAASKNRVLAISALSVLIAICISFIAKFLVYLINLVTNISFYGNTSLANTSPADNTLGIWVIFIPAAGGVIVGLMALYGSKAIRGHGIPEAMEQILTNQSKIKPTITYLKPISSAIAIGTGGPFGAEGPIIATGGALGSTFGQLLRITHNERKILLTAGSTAGMAAIFGSPVAAIFLGIELLLFEFSPRSIIPVALACITGAAGHHLLFGTSPVFAMDKFVETPRNISLGVYSAMGVVIGLLSVVVTKIVYFIEDSFEKLPIHWMWWPAIGGLAVGIVGYFYPRTLGVGYNNITDILSGSLPVYILLGLCFFKFISWSIALGSGTSGGTLAPLFIIGGAAGVLIGSIVLRYFPACGITLPLCGLVGMSAMFTGASRAFLTAIIFSIETTGQSNALLPLLGSCGGSYIVSFFLMNNTIMTEKISRRGIKTPDSYEPDILEKITAAEVMEKHELVVNEDNRVDEVIGWIDNNKETNYDYFIVTDENGEYSGIVKSSSLCDRNQKGDTMVGSLIADSTMVVNEDDSLRTAVEKMAKDGAEVLPVLNTETASVVGTLSYQNIITAYKQNLDQHTASFPSISLKRRSLKVLVRGQKMINSWKTRND